MNKKKRNINRFSMLIEQALIEERRVLMVNNGSRLSIVLSTVVLVIVILLISIIGLILIYPTEGGSVLNQTDDYNGMARFEVTFGKHDLEKVINSYLHQHMKTDGLSYSIDVTDQIQFNGDVRIIGKIVRLTVIFRPELQQNGDLVLHQQSFKVGGLRLPSSLVLEYVRRSYDFPEWIILQPAQKQIHLAVTSMQTESKIQIYVREFDLVNDQLKYDVYLANMHDF